MKNPADDGSGDGTKVRPQRVVHLVRWYHQPVAVGLVLLALLVAWNLAERGRSRALGLREARQATHGVADAVEASIQAQVRRGQLDMPQTRMILENVVASTEVTFVSLSAGDGTTLTAGDVPGWLDPVGDHGGVLRDGQYVHWEEVHLQDSPLPSRHRYPDFGAADPEADLDLGDRPQLLAVGMLAGGYVRHVGEATKRLNAILAVGVLCLAGLSLAWTLSIRNRELRGRLGEARVRAEHLAELGHAARGLAHETKNPLGLVRGLAQRIAGDDGVPPAARDSAATIMEQADTATARLGEFLAYARPRSAQPRPVDLMPLARRVCGLLAVDFAEAGVRLDCDGDDARVLADAEQVEQILVNLLLNSLQASPAGTAVTVSVTRDVGGVRLAVRDEGAGVAPELRDEVFKPYVTGRDDGHGLGLAIVRRMVEDHGWTVALRSPAGSGGRGTEVAIDGLVPAPEPVPAEETP